MTVKFAEPVVYAGQLRDIPFDLVFCGGLLDGLSIGGKIVEEVGSIRVHGLPLRGRQDGIERVQRSILGAYREHQVSISA